MERRSNLVGRQGDLGSNNGEGRCRASMLCRGAGDDDMGYRARYTVNDLEEVNWCIDLRSGFGSLSQRNLKEHSNPHPQLQAPSPIPQLCGSSLCQV